jgi:hypothetical protein
MTYCLYLDDIRNPSAKCFGKDWDIARNIEEAKQIILTKGAADMLCMSLDHDLGSVNGVLLPTGFDFAKWLVEADLNGTISLPLDLCIDCHSANPQGVKNILGLLRPYIEHKRKESNL